MLIKAVEAYLAMRRAVGFDLVPIARYLRHFAEFAHARGDRYVLAQTAIDWAATTASLTERRCRIMAVIRFARFMPRRRPVATRYLRIMFSASGVNDPRRISSAIKNCTGWSLTHASSNRSMDYDRKPTVPLFGLLAATGLRVSEARALTLDDITNDGLHIRQSKYKKSRLVPLHT